MWLIYDENKKVINYSETEPSEGNFEFADGFDVDSLITHDIYIIDGGISGIKKKVNQPTESERLKSLEETVNYLLGL